MRLHNLRPLVSCVARRRVGTSAYGATHAAPGLTHSLVTGQQTSPAAQEPFVDGSQNVPALTGVRQCLASGQQYDVFGQTLGGVHAGPTWTHILVSGQQVSPVAHGAVAEHAFGGSIGVRQCFASGQQ